MIFQDRESAGRQLAGRLERYRDDRTALILALPRGGVAVAFPVSLVLRLPLDVFITRKLGAPGNPEYAIGAVAETGTVFYNKAALALYSLSQRDLDAAIQVQRDEIARRQRLYRKGRPAPVLTGRTIILVDDGLATGATFFASVEAIRSSNPCRLIGAVPVGPRETIEEATGLVDEMVVLSIPEGFFAVGQAYIDFTQVEDADVVRYLDAAEAFRTQQHQPPAS